MTERGDDNNELHQRGVSRQEFLELTTAGLAGLLAGCSPAQHPPGTATSTLAEGATALPTAVPTATPTVAPPVTPVSRVAFCHSRCVP